MIGQEQLLEAEVRMRQAKERLDLAFGGLGIILSGDFLQLPPVERVGLAQEAVVSSSADRGAPEFDDIGDAGPECKKVAKVDEEVLAEARQGLSLWRAIPNVISLNVNVRAPGVLSRLQTEMRNGAISPAMWNL